MSFDKDTLAALHDATEVRISVGLPARKPVIIWVVVAGNEAFVRSVKGTDGRWYKTAATAGRGTLEVADRNLPIRLIPVADPAAIERVSQAYLAKYSNSPYAQAMVCADVLGTTLRVEPG
ncbi:MAG: DUF2255 family protein [Acetobacteraceae bacterium]